MAGTTRFGFASGRAEDAPDQTEDVRTAQTIFGRDLHLPARAPTEAPGESPGASATSTAENPQESAAPAEAPVGAFDDDLTATALRTGKSRFAALAGLFGRWTTGGGFRSMGAGEWDASSGVFPRQRYFRSAALVLAAAAASFFGVIGLLKLRDRDPGSASTPGVVAGPSCCEPKPPSMRAAAASAPVAPAMAPTPPIPTAAAARLRPSIDIAAPVIREDPPRPRKPAAVGRRRALPPRDPDGVMPLAL